MADREGHGRRSSRWRRRGEQDDFLRLQRWGRGAEIVDGKRRRLMLMVPSKREGEKWVLLGGVTV